VRPVLRLAAHELTIEQVDLVIGAENLRLG
jgi:hypothetical protein